MLKVLKRNDQELEEESQFLKKRMKMSRRKMKVLMDLVMIKLMVINLKSIKNPWSSKIPMYLK